MAEAKVLILIDIAKYVYISLDGNNRTITLFDADGGKVGLQSGTYHLIDHFNIQVKRGSNKIGKGLVDPLVDKFYNTKIQIIVYTDISKDEAGQVFRDINDGLTLNNHQKRQSYSSDLANWVRQIRKDYKQSLTKIFGKKEIVTLKADEFIAKCLCYTANKDFSGTALDSLYKEPGLVISAYLTKRDKWFQSTMKSFMKEIKRFKWTSKNSLFDLWVIISEYKTDDNTQILNMNKFVTCYYDKLTNLIGDTAVYDSPDKKLKEKVLDYSGLLSKSLNKKVGDFRRKVIRNLIENELDETIIVQQEHPKNRFFTKKQKNQLYKKQDGICPATKKRIPLEEIFDYTCGSFNRVMRWRKIPLYKNTYDFALYPTILTEIQPKTIIELGTGDGASCIWYKDILQSNNLESKIITFDTHKPVQYFEGIEYEQFNLNNINEVIFNNCPHPWLVIEDCHSNLSGILNYFDKQMISGDYLIIEDNSKRKQKIMDEFNNINNYAIDTRYSDFYGYNNCSFSDSILKKI